MHPDSATPAAVAAADITGHTNNTTIANPNTTTTTANKRPITLDLKPVQSATSDPTDAAAAAANITSAASLAKRQRFNSSVHATSSAAAVVSALNSPDMQMLKLVASPELEKFMTNAMVMQTPTPSLLYPVNVTAEQEEYAQGFMKVLNSLHSGQPTVVTPSEDLPPPPPSDDDQTAEAQQLPPLPNVASPAENINDVLLPNGDIIDDSPSPAAGPPSQLLPMRVHSPIDLSDQQRIKLERKRQRNRVAANKCRTLKLQRIAQLEDKVNDLRADNNDLAALLKQLKANVSQLKQQVVEHWNGGCNIGLDSTAALIASDRGDC